MAGRPAYTDNNATQPNLGFTELGNSETVPFMDETVPFMGKELANFHYINQFQDSQVLIG